MSRARRFASFNGHRTAWPARWALATWHLGHHGPLRRFGFTHPNQADRFC